MVRGGCKATITSNYTQTRLTPSNPTVPAQPVSDSTANFNPYMGEIDALAMAAGRPRVLRRPRGLLPGPAAVHAVDASARPASAAARSTSSTRAARARSTRTRPGSPRSPTSRCSAPRAAAPRPAPTAKTEHGILGIALDPQFGVAGANRNFIYVAYHPYYGGTMGRNTGTSMGPGFVRADYMAERRLSRFTYNETTKTLSDERIIHRYMTQVFSCCHLGGSMDFDSQGNLYFATGDNTGNTPNSTNGGYTNSHPQYTLPCPGDTDFRTYEGTGCGVDTSDPDGDRPAPAATAPCAAIPTRPDDQRDRLARGLRLHQLRRRAPDLGQHERVRGQAAADHAGEQPAGATTRASARRTRSRARPPRTARTCSRRPAQAVTRRQGEAGDLRHGRPQPVLDRRRRQDRQDRRGVGRSRPGHQQHHVWGPAKTENAVMINSAGNYGWPFCTGNQQGYRAKLPGHHRRRRSPAPAGHPGTVAGNDPPPASDGGGYWDCDDPQRASSTTRRSTPASSGSRRRGRPTSGTARRAVATTSRATPTTSRSTTAAEHRRHGRRADAIAAARSCSAAARRR